MKLEDFLDLLLREIVVTLLGGVMTFAILGLLDKNGAIMSLIDMQNATSVLVLGAIVLMIMIARQVCIFIIGVCLFVIDIICTIVWDFSHAVWDSFHAHN